jgi:transposase-like protein
MARQRNHYTAEFKAKIALAAIKGQQTVNEIAATSGMHPNQVLQWKKQALEVLPEVFSSRRMRTAQDDEALQARLYQQIGQLKVELDWLKKTIVVKLTPEKPKAVPTTQDRPSNHGEHASIYSSCPFAAGDGAYAESRWDRRRKTRQPSCQFAGGQTEWPPYCLPAE